jgi:imidazole glycerol-phosphate synthase subunit HisF
MSSGNPYKKGGMFEGASYLIFEKAKQLRKNMTPAETVLWMHLKAGLEGYKFRRQHPIGIYIADFYCHKAKLIIELDGSIHQLAEVQQNDNKREADLLEWGYQVIRFSNEEVFNKINFVLNRILADIKLIINNKNLNASPDSGV